MSIQSTMNQGIALTSALFSQSSLAKSIEAVRGAKVSVNEANRLASEIGSKMDEGYFNMDDPEIKAKFRTIKHLTSNIPKAQAKAFEKYPSARTAKNLARGYKADELNRIQVENLKKDMTNEDFMTAVNDAIAEVDYDVAYKYGIRENGSEVAKADAQRAAQEEATRRAQANLKLEQERLGSHMTDSGIYLGPGYGGAREGSKSVPAPTLEPKKIEEGEPK